MQQYQLERIYPLMEKEFGKMKAGEEERHAMMLFAMESNLLKIHRKYLQHQTAAGSEKRLH